MNRPRHCRGRTSRDTMALGPVSRISNPPSVYPGVNHVRHTDPRTDRQPATVRPHVENPCTDPPSRSWPDDGPGDRDSHGTDSACDAAGAGRSGCRDGGPYAGRTCQTRGRGCTTEGTVVARAGPAVMVELAVAGVLTV